MFTRKLFQFHAFSGFSISRDINALSYPDFWAAKTSASFSVLINSAFASRASAMSSKIFFRSSEDKL